MNFFVALLVLIVVITNRVNASTHMCSESCVKEAGKPKTCIRICKEDGKTVEVTTREDFSESISVESVSSVSSISSSEVARIFIPVESVSSVSSISSSEITQASVSESFSVSTSNKFSYSADTSKSESTSSELIETLHTSASEWSKTETIQTGTQAGTPTSNYFGSIFKAFRNMVS